MIDRPLIVVLMLGVEGELGRFIEPYQTAADELLPALRERGIQDRILVEFEQDAPETCALVYRWSQDRQYSAHIVVKLKPGVAPSPEHFGATLAQALSLHGQRVGWPPLPQAPSDRSPVYVIAPDSVDGPKQVRIGVESWGPPRAYVLAVHRDDVRRDLRTWWEASPCRDLGVRLFRGSSKAGVRVIVRGSECVVSVRSPGPYETPSASATETALADLAMGIDAVALRLAMDPPALTWRA